MDPRTDVLTGINYSDTQALKADTQLRLDQLFSSVPNTALGLPGIPEVGKSGALVNDGTNVNIPDFETMRQRVLANDYKNYQDTIKKQPVFEDSRFFDQQQTRRYIDEEWGFNPNIDNEDFYANRQGKGWMSVPHFMQHTILKVPMLAATKLGTGAGFVAGLLNPVNWFSGENLIAAASDNMMAKGFEKLEDNIKNDWMPVYQEAADRNKGFFSRAFTDLNFWTDDFADGAAFLASAFVPGLAVSKLNLGAKALGLGGKAIEAAQAAGKSAKYLESMVKTGELGNKVLTTVLNTASESMFEAAQVKDRIYNQLISEGKTHQEALSAAGHAAQNSFLLNSVALTFSNFWETNLMYKAMGRNPVKTATATLADTPLTKLYETAKASTKFGRALNSPLGFYAKKAGEAMLVEGFYEENIQLAIERINSGSNKNLFRQFFDQTIDAVKGDDTEASMSIGLGATIGALFGAGISKFNKEYTHEKVSRERLATVLNEARNAWIKGVDMYQQNEKGEFELDTAKLTSLVFNQFKNSMMVAGADAVKIPELREVYKKHAFASFVAAHLRNGTFDRLMDQLGKVDTFSAEELASLGFEPEAPSPTLKAEYIEYANRIKDLRDQIDNVPIENAYDQIRHEKLFEIGSTLEALKMEGRKLQGKISESAMKLEGFSLSDSIVESLNLLKQKKALYDQSAKHAKDPAFYTSQSDGIATEITRLELENAETLKKVKKDKDGYYQFEKDERNKSPFIGEYNQILSTIAGISNALEDTHNEFDRVNRDPEYLADMVAEEAKQAAEAEQEAIAAEQKRQAEEKAKEKAAEEAKQKEDAKKKPVAPTQATSTATNVPADQTAPVQTAPTPPPAGPKVNKARVMTFEEIMSEIPLTPYIDSDKLSQLNGAMFRAYEEGRLNDEQSDLISLTLAGKERVGTMVDTQDASNKLVALKLFRKEPLTDEQKLTFTFFKEQIEEELKKIQDLYDGVSTDAPTPEETPVNDEPPLDVIATPAEGVSEDSSEEPANDNIEYQDDPIGDHITDPTPVGDGMTSEEYDPESVDVDDDELTLDPALSFTAYASSLKTVTQEEDLDTNRLINDPYLRFKQRFLRTLLDGQAIASGTFTASLTKDRPEFPRDARAQAYLDNGGKYGEVLVITDQNGEMLYFDENYRWITKTEYEKGLTGTIDDTNIGANNFQPLVYSFNKDAWNTNLGERVAIAAERTGQDPARIIQQYAEEDEFLNTARDLINHGYSPRVNLDSVVAGAIRTGKVYRPAATILQNFPFTYEIVKSKKKDTKYVLVNGRFLVNGALYAVVQQPNEPPYHVRLVPNKIRETELYDDLRSLLDHTYTDAGDVDNAINYINNLLYIGKRRKFELKALESEGTYTITFVNKGEFTSHIDGIEELMNSSRFNVDNDAVQSGSFNSYYIKDGKLRAREINYHDLLVNNSTTVHIPQTEDGKPKFRAVNTYLIFTPHPANQELLNIVTNTAEEEARKIEKAQEKTPQEATDNSTLTTEKITRNRPAVGNDLSENDIIERLRRNVDEAGEDDLNMPLSAISTTEQRALIGEDEIQKVNQMFGRTILTNLSDIANAGMWGQWTVSGITLFKGAQEGTGYHEAWHHFSQMYLTPKQKRALYDEMRSRAIRFTTRDGKKMDTKSASDFHIEEFLADDFRDYVLNDGKSRAATRPKRNTIFRQILDFLKQFFGGGVNIQRLYEQLYQGQLNQYKPSMKNAMWGKLNAGIYNKEGVQLLDTVKTSYYNTVIDALVAKQLLAAKASPEQIRIDPTDSQKSKQAKLKLLGAIYSGVYKDIRENYYLPALNRYNEGDDSVESFMLELENVIENWPDVMAYNAANNKLNFYTTEEIPYVDIEETKDEEEEDRSPEETEQEILEVNKEDKEGDFAGKMFDRVGNETNSMVSAPLEIRAIVRMLPAMVWDGKKFVIERDANGFPKLADYAKTWNNIAFQLSGSLSYEEMYDRLSRPEVKEKIPQAEQLQLRLVDPRKSSPSLTETATAARFYSAFSRDYIGIFSGHFMKNSGKYYFLEETKRTADLITRNWNGNFLQHNSESEYFRDGYLMFDEQNDRFALNKDKKLTFNFQSVSDINYFLGLLGIQFSPVARANPAIIRLLPNALSAIQDNINARHAATQVFHNPIFELKDDLGRGDNRIEGVSSIISVLSRLEAKYSTETPSMSYMTAEGEMIYALSLRNFLSTSVNAINAAKNYQELIAAPEFAHYDFKNNPYIKYSHFMNAIFDMETSEKRKIKMDDGYHDVQLVMGNYNGLKIDGAKEVRASNTGLNARQKLIFDLNSMLTKGAQEIMRTESSASSFFIQLTSYHNGTVHPVKFQHFADNFRSPIFMDKIINYLEMELYRIKNFADETDVHQGIKDASKGYYMFRDILRLNKTKNPERLKDALKKDIQDMPIKDAIEKNRADIEKGIEGFFQHQYESLLRQMINENVNGGDLDSESMRRYNNNMAQIIRGFVANSFIMNAEFITMFDGDLVYQKDYKDYFKRAKGDVSTGRTPMIDPVFANYMRGTSKATFAGFLGADHLNDYRRVRSAVIEDYKTSSVYADMGIIADNLRAVRPGITQEEIDKVLEKYKDLTVADGQGHITLDFYRQFLKSISNWTVEQEITYQKELAWFRLNYSTEGNYSDAQRLRDQQFIERNADVNSHFPPLKIQYDGPIETKGTFAKVLDKFSVAPLIPSAIKGTHWERINIDLIKNGIGYTKFASGTKKYKHPSVKMYHGDRVGLDLREYKPSVHFLAYLKEQINTSPDVKEESTFGSQVRKLIFANLFSNGVSSEKNMARYTKYVNLMKEIIKIEKGRLFDELGLRENEEGKVAIHDMQKFVKTIQEQAQFRDLNDNIKDYIQYDKDTKNFRNPLEASLNRSQIQDMLMGIVDTRLRRLKINGDQLIQISGAGFEKTDFNYKPATAEQAQEFGTAGLKFYSLEKDENGKPIRTNPMEIKVALVGGFERLLNLPHPNDKAPIGNIERLNTLLKNPEWVKEHEKSISIVGYRIPTQGPNSIEFMRIAEFLPSSAGSAVVLPAEIVAKAGSDFDIDKMFVFRPSFKDDGSLVNNNTTNARERKDFLTNGIIELFQEVMSDPEMYEQLITPNNTDLVRPVALDVAIALGKKRSRDAAPHEGTQILRYINNLRKFESLLSGKNLLGIFAVNNTFSQLIQQGGVQMNVSYGKKGFKTSKLFLLSPEERKQVLSPDGKKINLSSSKDVTGVFKQEYFSQLINATVDIANDDFIGYVNLSYENAGVLSLLIHQGVPFERALWFINQPAMVDYYKRLRTQAGEKNRMEIQADILTEYGVTGLHHKLTGKLNYDELPLAIQRVINDQTIEDDFQLTPEYLKLAGDPVAYAKKKATVKKELLPVYRAYEKIAFAYFLALKEQAQSLQNFRGVLNYDTTKFATPIDVVSSFNKEKTITDPENGEGLFSREDVKAIAEKSVISPFSNKKLIWNIVQKVMPVGYDHRFLTEAGNMISKIFGRKKVQRASKLMANDWMEFIVKNFGVINGEPMHVWQTRLGRGKNSLARQLVTLKKKYPELQDKYALFQRMKPNFPKEIHDKVENLEIQRIFENTTADQNRYIAEFRELINFSDPNYTAMQQLEIQNFFKDAALYAFLQSGFNRSNISFQELVPSEFLADVFKRASDDFKNKLAVNDELTKEFIGMFLRKFESMHKPLFRAKARYTQTWRGKDYQLPAGYNEQIDNIVPKIQPVGQIRTPTAPQVSKEVKELAQKINTPVVAPQTKSAPESTPKNHPMYYKMPAGENLTGRDTTTLELAEMGIRTATTRSQALGKVGDIITFEGKPTKYIITGTEQLTQDKVKDPNWIKQWSQKEQWTTEHFNKVLGGGTVHVGSWQTSFKIYDLTNPAKQDRKQEIRDIFSTSDAFNKYLTVEVSPEMREKLLDAYIEEWDEGVDGVRFFKLPKGLSEQEVVDKINAFMKNEGKSTLPYAFLSHSNFAEMLEYYDEYGDAILDDNRADTDLDTIINEYSYVPVPVSGEIELEYASITEVFSDYQRSVREGEEHEALGKVLDRYGLRNIVDPNQISLFDSETLNKLNAKPKCK